MGLFDWLFGKKSASSGSPSERASPAGKLSPRWNAGDRVLAKWFDAFFYPGRVTSIAGNTAHVLFDDGYSAWVHVAHIQTIDIQIGSNVFARMRGGPQFFAATVHQQKGEKLQLRYESGEEEWTTISFVRVQRPIANVGAEEPPPGYQPAAMAKQQIDLGEKVEDESWRVGDRVLARWVDFYWYPGSLLAFGSRGFHVLFDDGDQRIVQHNNLMPLIVEEGESLFIRPKNEHQLIYQPAQVMRVKGETLDVEFEDGRRENNTRVSRARFWRCPVGVTRFPFEEGERVLAFDWDGCLYPAEIVTVQDDRVIVQCLDGPECMLTPELIRRFELRTGMRIECRWRGTPQYFPGILDRLEGERVFIKYDDGDEEWNSVRLVRVPPQRGGQ